MTETQTFPQRVCCARLLSLRLDELLCVALAPATLVNALTTHWLGRGLLNAPCLFTWITGRHCWGCGMTRALTQIWLGHLPQAVALNRMSPLVFGLLMLLFLQQMRGLVIYQKQIFQS